MKKKDYVEWILVGILGSLIMGYMLYRNVPATIILSFFAFWTFSILKAYTFVFLRKERKRKMKILTKTTVISLGKREDEFVETPTIKGYALLFGSLALTLISFPLVPKIILWIAKFF